MYSKWNYNSKFYKWRNIDFKSNDSKIKYHLKFMSFERLISYDAWFYTNVNVIKSNCQINLMRKNFKCGLSNVN